MDNSAVLYFI